MVQSHNHSVTAIIQARINSNRLPGKTIKKLCGKPVLAHIIERAQNIENVSSVIVATGNEKNNRSILKLAEDYGALPFSGPDDNVLKRFYEASLLTGSDFIMRITGDNPFTDVYYGSLAVEHALQSEADLSSITGIPLGTAVELIKKTALERAYHESTEYYHKEHVTPYIKENPGSFSIIRKPVHLLHNIPDLRLTIDTYEDFEFAEKIYASLYQGKPFSLTEVLDFLNNNKELLSINKDIHQRPMTHFEMSANEFHPTYIM